MRRRLIAPSLVLLFVLYRLYQLSLIMMVVQSCGDIDDDRPTPHPQPAIRAWYREVPHTTKLHPCLVARRCDERDCLAPTPDAFMSRHAVILVENDSLYPVTIDRINYASYITAR